MKKMFAALGVAALVGSGVAAFAIASPASAHTGDLKVTAVCNTTTGQYDVTSTLNITQTGLVGATKFKVGTSTFEGTPSASTPLNGGPVASTGAGTIALTSFTLPGTTTGFGPWVYAFTKWSDGYSKGSDGQLLQKLGGDCAIPDTKDATASASTNPPTCTLPGTVDFTITNAAWDDESDTTDGSRTATASTGHTFSDGSKTATVTYTPAAAATGNQSTDPSAPCYVAPPKPVSITALPPQFVDVCGVENDKVQVPAVEHVTYTTDDKRIDGVGTVKVTATADKGYVLDEKGSTVQDWKFDFTNEKCSTVPPVPTPEPTPPVTPTPEPTPPVTPTPVTSTPTPTPSETPKAAVPVVRNHTNPPAGTLAFTGSEGLGYGLAGALALLLAGTGLMVARRRKA